VPQSFLLVPVERNSRPSVYKTTTLPLRELKHLRAAFLWNARGHSAVCFMRRPACLVSARATIFNASSGKRPLERLRFVPRRAHPDVTFPHRSVKITGIAFG